MTLDNAQPQKTKRKLVRSPAFPFISLKAAIERARQFEAAEHTHPTFVPNAAAIWRYKPKSSGGLQTVGALKQYGLMIDEGSGAHRKVKLTDRARRILLDARENSPEREQAIKDAALEPPIHREMIKKWGAGPLPSETTFTTELILERGFSKDAARDFWRVYCETMQFAQMGESDIQSPGAEEPEREEGALGEGMMENPAIVEQPKKTQLPPPPPGGMPPVSEQEGFKVGSSCWVQVQFRGPITQRAIRKLIKHYEENLELYPGDVEE